MRTGYKNGEWKKKRNEKKLFEERKGKPYWFVLFFLLEMNRNEKRKKQKRKEKKREAKREKGLFLVFYPSLFRLKTKKTEKKETKKKRNREYFHAFPFWGEKKGSISRQSRALHAVVLKKKIKINIKRKQTGEGKKYKKKRKK